MIALGVESASHWIVEDGVLLVSDSNMVLIFGVLCQINAFYTRVWYSFMYFIHWF
jgi:type IV secretory pathway TrbD component